MQAIVIRTAKEFLRNALHKAGIRRHAEYLEAPTRRERFTKIYDTGVWRRGEAELPLSGRGSALAHTSAVRQQLPLLLKQLNAATVLDIGCGDMTWMKTLSIDAAYIGVDIVPSVIEQNRAALPDRSFSCLDAVADELPDADTVICREVLFHLSFEDIQSLIRNVGRRPRRWLIATTDRGTLINADIRSGDFRLLNLSAAPLRFPKPRFMIDDNAISPGRLLAVWDFAELPRF